MENTKRIIFSPTKENYEKMQIIKDNTGMSYSQLINAVFNAIDAKKITPNMNISNIQKAIISELL